jgi:dolichyl-diphosphooligosaccharide--protein glycosyltransferase
MSSSSESKPSSAAVASSSKSKTKSSASTSTFLWNAVWVGIALYVFTVVAKAAYHIRMGAINEYGPVIHEFDPYFNYRATEVRDRKKRKKSREGSFVFNHSHTDKNKRFHVQYLYWNGWQRFFQWFDRKVWYPLGRPVGTTIYPGMQFTAVWIKQYLLPDMSLNDICCYIPAWFGVLATIMTGLLAYECSIPWNTNRHLGHFILDMYYGTFTTKNGRNLGEKNTALKGGGKGGHGGWSPALECGLFAMAMMSIVPAHLMRSMGGGYDNESVAISAMVTTFYFWTRSLRNHDPYAYVFGILAGLAYFYMVAAWGGYVFVLNLIGVHAAVLVLLGRFSTKTYLAYTFFYAIGTTLAIQVPVVGMAPLKSLEQLGPFAVFLGYQLLMVLERIIQARQYDRKQAWTFRIQGFIVAGALLTMIAMFLTPKGYFGPISSRVRGLFVKHTKTGNPLVDSVAEHQPASSRAYFQYLHHVCSLAPLGYMVVFFKLSDASSFLLVWGTAAYFFSHKMVRLILLTAPIGCILGGIAAGRIFAWCVEQWWDDSAGSESEDTIDNAITTDESNKKKKGKIGKKTPPADSTSLSSFEGLAALQSAARSFSKSKEGVVTKKAISVLFLIIGYVAGIGFVRYCWRLSQDLSNPTILMKARLRDGKIITLDDYREAYWWLRDNTAEDARIMAWWDCTFVVEVKLKLSTYRLIPHALPSFSRYLKFC